MLSVKSNEPPFATNANWPSSSVATDVGPGPAANGLPAMADNAPVAGLML